MHLIKSLIKGITEMILFTLSFEFLVFLIVMMNMLLFLHSIKLLSFSYSMTFGFTDPFIFIVLFLGIILGLISYFKNYAVGGRH